MLETVRAYAALELAAAGERDDALEGLVRYCTGEARSPPRGWSDLRRSNGWIACATISRTTAARWRGSSSSGRADEASDIAWGLMFFWLIRGHAAEGLRWYEQTLSLPSLPPAAESRALVGAAVMWYTQGELGRAARRARRAPSALARDARRHGDVASWPSNLLGHVEHAVGNVDAARDGFSRSCRRVPGAGDSVGHRKCAERDGESSPSRPATSTRRNACSTRPRRCFDTPVRGS